MTERSLDQRPAIAAAIIVNDGHVLLVRRRIQEGTLSWQFPAGEIKQGEAPEEAAVREAREEVGLTLTATSTLGARVHPATGRTMIYVACNVLDGKAFIADSEEIAEIAWSTLDQLPHYIPHGIYQPVQDYLDAALKPAAPTGEPQRSK